MRYSLFSLLIVGLLLTATSSADDAKDEAIRKDRKRIQGTWQVTALTINGNKAKDEDAKKLTVVNDDKGTWNLRSGNMEISKGTSTFDPTKKPKTIDFTPTDGGGKGDQFLGIYQLGKNARKLCFAPAGKDRPTEFSSTPENQHILVEFERVKSE
ncbi:MAG: TIGR03067 domain-containing protein [Planctomycetaceae bacterium]|nr:TIGR03067 domain-containing protein [Planctomycetaceae bacterium]